MPDVVGLLPTLAQTVVYITLIVVLAGLVSGLVAVGVMQIVGRAVIHRRVLWRFFLEPRERVRMQRYRWQRWLRRLWPFYPSWRDDMTRRRGGPRAFSAAKILRIPERLLCRLYYRQITGQLLAAANAEAANRLGAAWTPVLDALAWSREGERDEEPAAWGAAEDAQPDAERLHAASRTIDILQAELGEASARAVSLWLAAIWTVVYFSAGALALGVEVIQPDGGTAEFLAFLGNALVIVLVAALLAACSSAVGLAAFSWLERVSAPR